MGNTELDEFYKFWQSLQDGEDATIPVVQLFVHSALTDVPPPNQKLFSLNNFERVELLSKNINKSHKDYENKILATADMAFSRINETNGAEDWLQFVLLLKFYVENTIYKDYILKTESQLYIKENSIELKPQYTISKKLQLIFNIQRVHDRFIDNNFDAAELILNELSFKWSELDQDKINILYQNFIFFLCTASWEKAIFNLRKMWQVINLMNNHDKHNYGAWDIWTCSLIFCWYFSLHNFEFNRLVTSKLGLHPDCMISNKKLVLITSLTPNQIKTLLPEKYYEYACGKIESLPIS